MAGERKASKREESSVIDAAALIAGIVAVSASSIGEEGAFTLMTLLSVSRY
jgi:hypothetical protein